MLRMNLRAQQLLFHQLFDASGYAVRGILPFKVFFKLFHGFMVFFPKPSLMQASLYVLLQASVVYPDNNAAVFAVLCQLMPGLSHTVSGYFFVTEGHTEAAVPLPQTHQQLSLC